MINYSEIKDLITELEEILDDRRFESSMLYGCDCGCGGDSLDSEENDRRDARAEELVLKLEELGVKVDVDYYGHMEVE